MISTNPLNTRRSPKLPKTDYCYHAPTLAGNGGRCFGTRRTSFRAISQDYFKNEAPQSFITEAVLFGVIVMTAAVPVINSASALLHLVRSFAVL